MLNRQTKWALTVIISGAILISASYMIESLNVCPINQLNLVHEIKNYDETKDPKTCDMLNTKISQFNFKCRSDIEELDCE
jgi:hypothetical protein